MRIGVVSDTHGAVRSAQKAARALASLRVDLVVHCGDIGTAGVVAQLSQFPSHYVFGNMDDHATLRAAIAAAGATCHERFGHLQLAGRSVAFLHGDDAGLLRRTIGCGQWDLVCHGHTHVAAKFTQGTTLVVNPGAIQRTHAPSVAVIDLPSLEVTQIPL
jgi:hypothetical protein